ncbi:hypothetical protein DXV75_08360 [Alteromonas aestuariivivens]|uniref:Uncharacterized protein n=1 Tax=Alteromonas aestuariivivens TaxID=1938339 RepID=A0A3D8M8L7_9ALTE|nr:hypothetical protein [Alteromonas aestuariivivens]RDV26082.1 hypothetical protein DXV75_08360 [Alteromonas aestuariivivens]
MISKHPRLSPIATALSALLLTACGGGDTDTPSNDRSGEPNPLTFTEAGTSVELSYTTAAQLIAENNEFNGEALTVAFKPDNPVISGLDDFQTHHFTLTAPQSIQAPDPDKCPADPDYLIDTPYKNSLVYANVNPTAPNSGHASGDPVTSVLNGDEFSLNFAIPGGFYDMTFEAGLTFAGQTYNFQVVTPPAGDTLRDDTLEFDRSEILSKDGSEVIAVADGQTISFVSTMPIRGLSNQFKSDFELVSDQDTYIVENDDGSTEVRPVATIEVFSHSKMTKNDLQPYSQCAQNGDYLRINFNLPDYVFDQTYRAQIAWPYEEVVYDMIQQQDDDGNPVWDEQGNAVMIPRRDERNIPVVLSRQTKTQIIPFEVTTEARDTEFDAIDGAIFSEDPRNSGAKISTEEKVEELVYSVNLQGYNEKLPVSVGAKMLDPETGEQVPVTGQVLYSIDGRFFTDEPEALIEPGQTLQIKVLMPSDYVTSIWPSFTVGDQSFEWQVKTKADPELPVLEANIEFPAPVSATASNTLILRGRANLNTGNDGLSNDQLLVNGNAVDSYDPETGIWTYEADIGNYGAGEQIEFVLTSAVDSTITPFDLINLRPVKVQVEKLESKNTLFPDDAGAFSDLVDVAVDGRGGFPIFYLAEYTGKQVTELVMGSSIDKMATPLALYGSTELQKKIGGITINNYRPVTDGNYLIRHAWDGPHLRVSDLKNYPNLSVMATPDAYLQGLGNTIWSARQTAMSEDGNTVYVTGNDGLGRITMNYNLAGSPIQNNDSTTHRKWISRKTFGNTTNFGGTVSVDLLYVGEGEARTEYIVTLVQSNDASKARVYATTKKDVYDENVPMTQLNLVDSSGNPVELPDSLSIAIDDETQAAFISFGAQIAKLDLSNLPSIVEASPQGGMAIQTTETQVMTLSSSENTIGRLSAVVMEGGLPYLVATDMTESALYAIDHLTGEVVYLLQAANK